MCCSVLQTNCGKEYGVSKGSIVKEQKFRDFHMIVRAADPSYAGKIMDNGILNKLADLAMNLPFRPEIQIRGKRLVVYLADRNATDDIETLEKLFDLAISTANIKDLGD